MDSAKIKSFDSNVLGHFGPYGGRFVPEALIAALDELADAHLTAQADPEFHKELDNLHKTYHDKESEQIQALQNAAINNENIFEVLMDATKYCSLGQITAGLFEVGGQYRRNM